MVRTVNVQAGWQAVPPDQGRGCRPSAVDTAQVHTVLWCFSEHHACGMPTGAAVRIAK